METSTTQLRDGLRLEWSGWKFGDLIPRAMAEGAPVAVYIETLDGSGLVSQLRWVLNRFGIPLFGNQGVCVRIEDIPAGFFDNTGIFPGYDAVWWLSRMPDDGIAPPFITFYGAEGPSYLPIWAAERPATPLADWRPVRKWMVEHAAFAGVSSAYRTLLATLDDRPNRDAP